MTGAKGKLKRYASVKRVSLAGVSEGWDETCYAYVIPANFKTRLAEAKLSEKSTEAQRDDFQRKLITDHFVSGRIKFFDGEKFTEDDLTLDIATETVDVSNKLAMFVLGYDIDPKDFQKAQMTPDEPSSKSVSTETPSSTNLGTSPDTSPKS